jgi:transposase
MPPVRRKNKKIDDSIRERIIELVALQAKTMASVASALNISASTVRSIVNTFIRASRIAKLPRGSKHISKIQQPYLDWLTENMDEFAGRSVEWLTNKLNERFQIQPPLARRTINRSINKLTTYILKLMRAETERYNDPEHTEARQQWAENVLQGPGNMNRFIFIDEAGFNLHITRRYGRAPRGRHAIQRVPYNHGLNMSLVIAIDQTGVLAYHFKLGAFNQESFTEFLENQLFPRLDGRHRVLLLDNAKFHKTQRVRDAITASGHTLFFLPPYSPYLNAAESAFGSIKTHVRQEIVQAETLEGHVTNGLARINAAMARGWIREVGRNFQLLLAGERLGHLYDIHQVLPEGYQDPYIEDWDGKPDLEDREEEEDLGGEEEVEVEEEVEEVGEVEEEREEEREEEGGKEDEDEEKRLVRSHARKYSPFRTRSGKVRY